VVERGVPGHLVLKALDLSLQLYHLLGQLLLL
jgi:hypothetical protein